MLIPCGPKSTKERQAAFQKRNPGYDRRRKARHRQTHAQKVQFALEWQRMIAEAEQAEAAKLEKPRISVSTQLCLPAPVESLAMVAINELSQRLAAERVRAA